MGQVTRRDVTEMIDKLRRKMKSDKDALDAAGIGEIFEKAFSAIEGQLRGTGPVTVVLRQQARVLKHFIEDYKGPHIFIHFEHVMSRVTLGVDPTQAIKRARSELDVEKRLREIQKLARDYLKQPAAV